MARVANDLRLSKAYPYEMSVTILEDLNEGGRGGKVTSIQGQYKVGLGLF